MGEDLEQFKEKIKSYDKSELEEILVTLNKHKFPEKFQAVREILMAQSNSVTDVSKKEVSKLPEKSEAEEKDAVIQNTGDVKVNSEKKDRKAGNSDPFDLTLTFIAVITAIIALYCLLQSFMDLPGKNYIKELSKKFAPTKAKVAPKKV